MSLEHSETAARQITDPDESSETSNAETRTDTPDEAPETTITVSDGKGKGKRSSGRRRQAGEASGLKAGAAGLPGSLRMRRKSGGKRRAAAETDETAETGAAAAEDAPPEEAAPPADAPSAEATTARAPDRPEPEDTAPRRPTEEAPDEGKTDTETAEDDESDASGGGGGKKGNRKKSGKGNAAPEPKVVYIPPPTVPSARPPARHWGVLASFFLLVVAPFAIAGWYLYERAADQYASTMGFSVRKEEATSNFEDIGSAFGFGSQSSSDTDVLYEFIQSQELVERIDAALDLRMIYSKPENDPVFAIPDNASVEDLVDYWQRMITIFYDAGSGLMEVRVLAFDPNDAQNIARAIFEESSSMINALTAIARDDSTRYARQDLERAVEDLKVARAALTEFRARTQIVDPNADIQGQMGLLNTLQAELANALIDLDLLRETAREGDPRIRQTEQRIEVIENRIAEERKKFGGTSEEAGRGDYATLVNEYESLIVDREFAESSYLAALTNFNAAQAEATRQSRYLAPYIRPTLATSSEYPRREVILIVLGLVLSMSWAIVAMLYYSIKDRR